MFKHHGCKCVHHTFVEVLTLLVWVSAIGFFISSWFGGYLYAFDSEYFFQTAVMLSLIIFGTRFCTCCADASSRSVTGMNCSLCPTPNGKMACCMDANGNCEHAPNHKD